VLICILTEDWLGDSLVSGVIDTCQEAGVNLKEFGRRYLTALSLSRFNKPKENTFCGDMDQLGKERIFSATENEAKR
jgi:hypothetical protein